MKMITKIYEQCSEFLPIIGGATGAATQASQFTQYLPEWEMVISTIIITAIGACVGYIVKLLLDRLFKKKKSL